MKRFLCAVLLVALLVACLPIHTSLATVDDPVESDNVFKYSYTSVIESYLLKNEDGTFTRLEHDDGTLVRETYNESFELLSSTVMELELPYFSGFYEGSEHYFIAFDDSNPDEDDQKEVIRLVCYSKSWQRLGAASLRGVQAVCAAYAGSFRMTELNGNIYAETGRLMYETPDGLNHQSNLFFYAEIADMCDEDQTCEAKQIHAGYVSHSFNQFVIADGERLLTLDHGDAYPRAAVIQEYVWNEFGNLYVIAEAYVMDFYGELGDNATGAELGAFDCSSTSYITAGISVVQDGTVEPYGQRNIFLGITPKERLTSEATDIRWVTNYAPDADITVGIPYMVKINADKFLLMWMEDDMLRYVFIDGNGNLLGEIYSASAMLSDCVPIVHEKRLYWYVTDHSKPLFFTLSLEEPSKVEHSVLAYEVMLVNDYGEPKEQSFRVVYDQPYDLPEAEGAKKYQHFKGWYTQPAYGYEEGELVTAQTLVTSFQPHTLYAHWEIENHEHVHDFVRSELATCTAPQFDIYVCKYCHDQVYRTQGAPSGHSWDKGVITADPENEAVREKIMTCTQCGETKSLILHTDGKCSGGLNCVSGIFYDAPATGNWAHAGIDYAVFYGLFNGVSNDSFAPQTSMTRAMLVTVLWRYEGSPQEGKNTFSDVKDGQWYTQAIAWAAENEIVGGVGNGKFAPDATVTREQLATILYRYCASKGLDVSKRAELSSFPDAGKVGSWAKEAVSWAVAEGVISGVQNGSKVYLQPQGSATRAQVATILMRCIENIL